MTRRIYIAKSDANHCGSTCADRPAWSPTPYYRLPLLTYCGSIIGVIRSFTDSNTDRVWHRQRTKLQPETQRRAWNKLAILNRAATLSDLRVPPGNRLEQLRGERSGQHSIRINQQWRICFRWTEAGAENVQIIDYH